MQSDKSDKKDLSTAIITTLKAPIGVVSDIVDKNERESTRQAKERFLAIFENIGGAFVSLVARQAGISRDTYYRWIREDEEFKSKIYQRQRYLNDIANDLLFMKVLQGDGPSIRFYLAHRHPDYMPRNNHTCQENTAPQKTLEDLLDEDEEKLNKTPSLDIKS